jgi:hypothetical protein
VDVVLFRRRPKEFAMVAANAPGDHLPDELSDAPAGVGVRAVSEKKRAANRANARQSTGPRTDEGKKIVSLNAVKHGVHARAALLPGEDPAELDALDQGMRADLKPAGMMQEVIVERIVSLAWKLRRIAFAEEAALVMDQKSLDRRNEVRLMFGREQSPPVMGGAALAIDVAAKQEAHLDKLLELELKLQRSMQQAINLLLKLKKERPENDGEPLPLPARVLLSTASDGGELIKSGIGQDEATAQNEATEMRADATSLSRSVAVDEADRQNEATETPGVEEPQAGKPGPPPHGGSIAGDDANRQNKATNSETVTAESANLTSLIDAISIQNR